MKDCRPIGPYSCGSRENKDSKDTQSDSSIRLYNFVPCTIMKENLEKSHDTRNIYRAYMSMVLATDDVVDLLYKMTNEHGSDGCVI